MKKRMLTIAAGLLFFYVFVCLCLYFFQERLIFFPEKLATDYRFPFREKFSEVTFTSNDGTALHALLFNADSARGVIFYVHGNAGSLRSWGEVAGEYTGLGYDVFMPDYRGYGKSDGKIQREDQLLQDVQAAYDKLKQSYPENRIVVVGYSLGTGLAAKVAATNHPRLLLLQAPYYSLPDVMRRHYPIIPTFLLKYRLETYRLIPLCRIPVILFHGRRDEVIPYQSSVKLAALLKPGDRLVTLENASHNGISSHPDYEREIRQILLP